MPMAKKKIKADKNFITKLLLKIPRNPTPPLPIIIRKRTQTGLLTSPTTIFLRLVLKNRIFEGRIKIFLSFTMGYPNFK